ncbi:MAG TPA: pyridoxamine 5'-phosphate oxidase family protein [Acidimicrobiia bacterium]|nr:pyridoxamine 5'-phosphate oxidase family protein [Acidimicrobiia bacterium]
MIDAAAKEFLEAPCSLIVGTVDDDGLPDATRAWAVDVEADGRLRVLLTANADVALANLRANGRIALTATDFVTLDSMQVKGHVTAVEPRTSADEVRFDSNWARCIAVLVDADLAAAEVIERFAPPGVVACVMVVEAIFDQTPGPAAGTRLAPTGIRS